MKTCARSLLRRVMKTLIGGGAAKANPYEHLRRLHREEPVPGDVPRGHLVVYVGEEHKRFIVRVCFLRHPLFRELLELARVEYGFIANSKLCIPCDEHVFCSILHCIQSQQHSEICPCF